MTKSNYAFSLIECGWGGGEVNAVDIMRNKVVSKIEKTDKAYFEWIGALQPA